MSDSLWLAYERLNCTDCMARLRETELHSLDGSLNRDSPWLAYERLNCTDCMARLRETELHRLDGSLDRDRRELPALVFCEQSVTPSPACKPCARCSTTIPSFSSQHGEEASEFGVFDERAGVVSRRGGNDVFRRLTQGRRTMY